MVAADDKFSSYSEESSCYSKFSMNRVHDKVHSEWESLRRDLLNGKFAYDDVDSAKRHIFLSTYLELYRQCNGEAFFSTSLSRLYSNSIFIRGTKLGENEEFPSPERFIPFSKYITEANRFSPEKVEWLYLALGFPKNTDGKSNGICCAMRECRVRAGDRFAISRFGLNSKDAKLIDLTFGEDWSPEKQRQELRAQISHDRTSGKIYTLDEYMSNPIVLKNILAAYSHIISEELFVKVETNDKKKEYIPFHCIASFFISLGYEGIIYKSTVFSGGKNLVLFDKQLSVPIKSSIQIVPVD